MSENVGVWIDHKNACIIRPDEETIQVIPSNLTPRVHGGGRRIDGTYNQGLDSELGHNDHYEHQLHDYYTRVLEQIQKAEHIFVMGPGEAKHEFEKILQKHRELRERLLKVETADKMTGRQMSAHVRKVFLTELAA